MYYVGSGIIVAIQ